MMSDVGACAGACVAPCVCPERTDEPTPGADTSAIILGAGAGTRFGDARGKQFVELAGMPLIAWSVLAFDSVPCVGRLVVVAPAGRERDLLEALGGLTLRHEMTVVPGGATRQESVMAGLVATDEALPLVAIHDGARPLIERPLIERCLDAVRTDASVDGAILATRATDTLKVVDDAGRIVVTPDRSNIWCAQTPQCFRREAIMAAHDAALLSAYVGTDDASLIEWQGGVVRVVEGAHDNLKVTYPSDLGLAEAMLAARIGIL